MKLNNIMVQASKVENGAKNDVENMWEELRHGMSGYLSWQPISCHVILTLNWSIITVNTSDDVTVAEIFTKMRFLIRTMNPGTLEKMNFLFKKISYFGSLFVFLN